MLKLKTIPLEAHHDRRGLLLGNSSKNMGKQIRHFFIATINPGESRGNHYHHHKKEWFIILGGKARMDLTDIADKKRKSYIIDSDEHLAYEMPPKIIHAIKNISKKPIILIALVNEFLDKNNPDTS